MDFVDATVNDVLPSDYLRKTDVASSAHGLEVRVPFLGNQVLDFASTLDAKNLYRRNRTKLITRSLLRQYLPPELCNLPKSGFSIPLMRVLSRSDRDGLASRITSSSVLKDLINPAYAGEIASAFFRKRPIRVFRD